jgi:uncharacterized membrane protein
MLDKSSNLKEFKFIFLIIMALVLILACILFSEIEFDDLNKDNFGQLGDYFGGILTPFLTFFTLIYLIKSINQQSKVIELTSQQLDTSSKELELSRKEMERSRIELRASATAQEEQANLLKISNNQSLVRNEVIQCVDLITSLQNKINKALNNQVTIYTSKEAGNTIAISDIGESFTDSLEAGSKPARFNGVISLSGVAMNEPRRCKLEEARFYEPAIDYGNVIYSLRVELNIRKLENLIFEFFYAFNTLLHSNGIMFCLHYANELSRATHKVLCFSRSRGWVEVIKNNSVIAIEILAQLENSGFKEDKDHLVIAHVKAPIDNITKLCNGILEKQE